MVLFQGLGKFIRKQVARGLERLECEINKQVDQEVSVLRVDRNSFASPHSREICHDDSLSPLQQASMVSSHQASRLN
jgi:hypothetical protein